MCLPPRSPPRRRTQGRGVAACRAPTAAGRWTLQAKGGAGGCVRVAGRVLVEGPGVGSEWRLPGLSRDATNTTCLLRRANASCAHSTMKQMRVLPPPAVRPCPQRMHAHTCTWMLGKPSGKHAQLTAPMWNRSGHAACISRARPSASACVHPCTRAHGACRPAAAATPACTHGPVSGQLRGAACAQGLGLAFRVQQHDGGRVVGIVHGSLAGTKSISNRTRARGVGNQCGWSAAARTAIHR